jgi:hypothetical protein
MVVVVHGMIVRVAGEMICKTVDSGQWSASQRVSKTARQRGERANFAHGVRGLPAIPIERKVRAPGSVISLRG